MDSPANVARILDSNRWTSFLESTAGGLLLHLTLSGPDGTIYTRVPAHCPRCGGACEPASGPSHSFPLPHGLSGIARDCSRGGSESGPPLTTRAGVAHKLLGSFMGALGAELHAGQKAVELSTLRQMNQILISLFHGEDRASERAYDLILSALIIVLDAEGSFLAYEVDGAERLQTKGDEGLVRSELAAPTEVTHTVHVANGRFVGKLGVVAPADRSQAEALLPLLAQECVIVFEVERLFRLVQGQMTRVLGAVGSAVLLLDRSGVITYVNPAGEQILGRCAADLVGTPCRTVPAPWLQAVSGPDAPVRGYLSTLETPSGHRKVDWQVGRIRDGEELAGWLVLADDRTDFARWQDAARHGERVAATATLVSGLMEQVRSPLLGAHAMLDFLGQGTPPRQSAYYASQIKMELERIIELLNKVADLTRPGVGSLEPLALHVLLRGLKPVLSRLVASHQCELELNLNSVPKGLGEPNELMYVAVELVRNAAEAVGAGGKIRIALTELHGGSCLTVSDSGPGFSAEVRERLFQPFNSTKGRTAGLGLVTVQSIVHRHGGWIHAGNGPDGGAQVVVWVPPKPQSGKPQSPVDVLVAIGDPLVRLTVDQVLRAAGFSTVAVAQATELHSVFSGLSPAVLLTDEWTIGTDDICVLQQAVPATRLVIIGQAPSEPVPGVYLVERPIDYAVLISRIHTAVDQPRGGVH